MAKNTFTLSIGIEHSSEQILTFSSRAKANKALREIEPLIIGQRYYNEPEKEHHCIVCAEGEIVLLVNKVVYARIIDRAEWARRTAFIDEHTVEIAAQVNATLAKALAELLRPAVVAKEPVTPVQRNKASREIIKERLKQIREEEKDINTPEDDIMEVEDDMLPDKYIHHIDGDPHNNEPTNLKMV